MNLQRSLFRKYLVVLIGVICGTLFAASVAQILLALHEQRERADALLAAEARLASLRIESFLATIVTPMAWVLDHDQPGMAPDLAQVRGESLRVLRQAPSIAALRYVGGDGCVRVEVARVGVDRVGGCAAPAGPRDDVLVRAARVRRVAFGPVTFRDGSLPFMTIAVAARGRHGGVLLADLDLRQIHATIAAIRIGASGHAYVVDGAWQLVAHPDNSLVLRHLDLRGVPAVQAAQGTRRAATLGTDIAGDYVLSAATTVSGPDWRVFVQLPAAEAFQPVVALLWLTLLIIAVALLGAAAASYRLARRMTRPILAVRAGAARMAAGDLGTRIAVATGDEVELLAHEFNRMAAALGDSYALLEEKVRQRTGALEVAGAQVAQQARELAALNAELSNRLAELALRKEEAERASAAKTRFLAAASHDLLQPMHAVGLLVGILRQRIRYPEVAELVRKVEATVKGMEALFGSLLDVSKLDSQAVRVDAHEVELDSVLRFVELHFQPIALEKGIALRVVRCRHTVMTDPALLERIVANLVSNAIRYTERGKVLVGCRRHGDAVHIHVHDTGIGIPPAFQEQVFDEFFQIDGTARPPGKGLGLGLSIVRRSVALLGLELTLRSRPGVGSVFTVVLPLHRAAAPRLPPPALSPALAPVAHEHLRGAFVAIVDDDVDACDAMEQLLRTAGCHVIGGASSDTVRGKLADHLRMPDLIVTDLQLGRHDSGLRAIAGIRADAETPIPALIVTGDARPPDELPDLCLLARKPLGPARLLQLCDEMLSGAAACRSADPVSLPR